MFKVFNTLIKRYSYLKRKSECLWMQLIPNVHVQSKVKGHGPQTSIILNPWFVNNSININSHLKSLNLKKRTSTYDVGNQGPILGKAHRCCRVKPVNEILTPYPWYFDLPAHGISSPLSRVFWPPAYHSIRNEGVKIPWGFNLPYRGVCFQ
jgi:hypothetical protein